MSITKFGYFQMSPTEGEVRELWRLIRFSCDFYPLLQLLYENLGLCGGVQTLCYWEVMGAPSWEGQECRPFPPPPHSSLPYQELEESESLSSIALGGGGNLLSWAGRESTLK